MLKFQITLPKAPGPMIGGSGQAVRIWVLKQQYLSLLKRILLCKSYLLKSSKQTECIIES